MRTIIWTIFLLAGLALVGWSMWTFYSAQPQDQSKARRAIGALWAGLTALAAYVASWFASPPPVGGL
jgi:hypothetical protein